MEIKIKDINSKITQERHTKTIIESIRSQYGEGMKNCREIELNIEDCYLNYPSTPLLIDFFLETLSERNGQKKLSVKYDLLNKENYILRYLVLEGKFFGIDNRMESQEKLDEAKEIINQKLKEQNITLTVVCTLSNILNDSNTYTYGN